MKNKEKIFEFFNQLYKNPKCALEYKTPYELLVAVVLSAQCTDKRVNIVTKDLFQLANTPRDMLALGESQLKKIIYPCGFYNNKAKSIIGLSEDIVNNFNGEVPKTMEGLTSLRGVGRKSANVVLAVAFGKQTIAVDTHVLRVSKRLGLTNKDASPYDCEMSLLKIVPKNNRSKFHHQAVWFGRDICHAQKPNCEQCKLKDICLYYREKQLKG